MPTARQVDVLAAFVAAGGSVADAEAHVGIRPSTAKRHLADLSAKSGRSTEQLTYVGTAAGWLDSCPTSRAGGHLTADAFRLRGSGASVPLVRADAGDEAVSVIR